MKRLFAAAGLVTLLAAPAFAAKDSVTLGMQLEPPNLDPTGGAAAAIREVDYLNVFEGLTRIDESLNPHPLLADSWTLSPDGLVYTFKLHPGVKFHDGAAFDCSVVKFSYERAVALYGGRLGLDLRLDRANPQWGTRLLFFRCGGAVVEISADLKSPVSDGPDRITGLAWRVADPDAAQARLAAAGLDVSPVRAGRKPGTRVFTVRAGVPCAPALMLGGADT